MLKRPTYEELLKYNIYEAIKLRTKEYTCELDDYGNNPIRIPNNPLFLDYDYVYEHCEKLFINNLYNYQRYASAEAYYILFKALTNKYSLVDDYENYILGKFPFIRMKWQIFWRELIEFLSLTFDERANQLFAKEEVRDYFFRHWDLFTLDDLKGFGSNFQKILFNYPEYMQKILNNPLYLYSLIHKYPKIEIPAKIMLDLEVIKKITHTYNLEIMHYQLSFLEEQCCIEPYYEEHHKFCDKEISLITADILPCYQTYYENAPQIITRDTYSKNNFKDFELVFQNLGVSKLPKKKFFQELSKYMLVGLFISRYYDTSPSNLYIDITTLYEFAHKYGRKLQGMKFYEFLINFPKFSIKEIIEFYQEAKNYPLKDMLYDDWLKQKALLVAEINSQNINPVNLPVLMRDDEIIYYDITDYEGIILVHNESLIDSSKENIASLITKIQNGGYPYLSLSIQDKYHHNFYKRNLEKLGIKFMYGKIKAEYLGTVYHDDAYTIGPDRVEIEFDSYIRRLYTLKSLLDETTNYNELVYVILNEPFFPIGILCEEEITKKDIYFHRVLNIPIFLRRKKEIISEREELVSDRKFENNSPLIKKRQKYIKNPYFDN